MNVLITGINGYIGSYLYNNLRFNNKYGIYGTSITDKKKIKKNLFKLDLTKKINLKTKKLKVDCIIHCASKSPYHRETKSNFNKNILITENLISLATNLKIKKFIFLSSNSIYKNINSNNIKENARLKKIGLYAKSKIKSEKMLISWSQEENIKVIIIRLPGVVGTNSQNTFISKINSKIKNNEIIIIDNLKTKFNNIIDLKSLGKIITKVVSLNLDTEIFNISSNKPISILKIINLFEKKFKKKIYLKDLKKKIKKNIINSNKFQKKLISLPNVENVIKNYLNENNI